MDQTIFAVLMLFPAVALILVVLSTFCGWVKAYLAISWIPITIYLIIYMFLNISYQPDVNTLKLMLKAVSWTSLIQGLAGVIITISASLKKEDWVIPAIATLTTILPFFLAK